MTSDEHLAFPCLAKFRAQCHNCGERIEAGESAEFDWRMGKVAAPEE